MGDLFISIDFNNKAFFYVPNGIVEKHSKILFKVELHYFFGIAFKGLVQFNQMATDQNLNDLFNIELY